ncbi:G protein-coupled receptor, class C, group 5, member Bb isoform X2 [Conger conger]|uniref:G protein-coupled receptor, class C, group 5, member Bb isoform X2 n=1 Tax=Conger conger TaxID=82655 RepID=UPI002A59C027|nr:G protein-coupled receptor, class C, group 5, member Bb isoform X2 [Conger conger]XP_061078336.1 G protein-coupled receptor, class C, group 5, member Bb isoform X2 [Conger conger]
MSLSVVVLLLLSAAAPGSAQSNGTAPPPQGCGQTLGRSYRLLCDLEAVWGVVLECVAGGGVLACLVLAGVLLGRQRRITEPEKRSGVAPLLLLLFGATGLFGLSFAFLIQPGGALCAARRALWGALFALCFACLLAQGWRVQRLARGARAPGGRALAGLALALTAVQGIIAAEWLLLTVVREGRPACLFHPLDFALACSYVGALLLAAALTAALGLCGKERRWRCNAVWLFVSCLASVLLWAAWLGFYLYGNEALGRADWDDPALAVTLVAQGWVLLLLHAVPEAHLCLRPDPQPQTPDYFDTSQPPPRLRETSFDEDLPLSHRPYMENHAFSFDEHSAALRPGYRSSNIGLRNSGVPFRSNVYQPTEMAVVLNGGTIPTAPPNYSGRPQW